MATFDSTVRASMKCAFLCGTFAVLLGGLAGCESMHKEHEENEVSMTVSEVPQAVREALVREAGGATIKTVDKEESNGMIVYETDVMMNGQNWEIKVDQNGKLISKKMDKE